MVMNKADQVAAIVMEGLCRRYDAVAASALKREGLGELIQTAESIINENKGNLVTG